MCYQAHSWPLPRAAIYSTLRAASSEQRASSDMTIAVNWLSQPVSRSSSQSQSRARRWSIVALANK